MIIITWMKEEKIIDMNNIMKENEINQENERFLNKIDLKINDNNDDYWEKDFLEEMNLKMNDNNYD